MKLIIKLFILTILAANAFGQNSEKLYPIIKDDLYGYMDKKGNTIIQPQFLSAGKFSEGLAPARLKGTYGYIDTKGIFSIPPKFDLALPFYKGLAKVFIDGKPYIINKKGEIIFNHNYKSISGFGDHSLSTVVTQTAKYGVVNKMGNLIIDTLFSKISQFTNGIAVVNGLNHNPYSNDSVETVIYEIGIIDTLGNWKVNYGKYKNIGDFKNGYAPVELFEEQQKEYTTNEGIIDESGNYQFTVPSKKWRFDFNDGNFYDDIAIVNIFSVDPDTIKVWSSKNRYHYKGAVNTKGEIILSNRDWVELTPFSYHRAFAKTTDNQWFLIDTKGEKVVPEPFDAILYDPFSPQTNPLFINGITIVKTKKGWRTIDTNGQFSSEQKLLNVKDRSLMRHGNLIVLEEDTSDSGDYLYNYGFWNIETNTIIPPQFHLIDWNGYDNELIPVIKDSTFSYVNLKGENIWEGQNKTKSKQLNIDYMNRGYYHASSKYKKELAGYGGWGNSENRSKNINNKASFLPNTLQLVLDPNQKTKWTEHYEAIKLYVVNTSKNTMYFEAQDSRLYLKIQAQDRHGEWKDIEYLPNSWCGNSYHTLFLAPNELWEFATPMYEGEFKTKIRAELLYRKSKNQKNHEFIYSNEIEGYVNPGQFWNKQDYFPGGLMDPYDD